MAWVCSNPHCSKNGLRDSTKEGELLITEPNCLYCGNPMVEVGCHKTALWPIEAVRQLLADVFGN